MKLYNYSASTGEYLGKSEAQLDPLESIKAGTDVFLNLATATLIAPPEAGANQKAVWQGEQWSLVDDYRGQTYYNRENGQPATIAELGVAIPGDSILKAPPAGLFSPQWNGKKWMETALLHQGVVVQTKAAVDRITAQRIANLGEDKAKTEKLIAGTKACPIWDDFIAARAVILQEGDDFIAANKLT
jgi:hypothetical protein